MNKKAENFKKYLDEKDIKAFTVDEIKDDQFQTVVFRSAADINGNRLPLIVILDTSIYGMIRVLVAPKVLHDDNEARCLCGEFVHPHRGERGGRLTAFFRLVDDDEMPRLRIACRRSEPCSLDYALRLFTLHWPGRVVCPVALPPVDKLINIVHRSILKIPSGGSGICRLCRTRCSRPSLCRWS